jgi:hypothetical protein
LIVAVAITIMQLGGVVRSTPVYASRSYTATITYRRRDPDRLNAAAVVLQRLADSFNAAPFQMQYSFIKTALDNQIYPDGYPLYVTDAASLLNMLVHRTYFWDADRIEKAVFLEIAGNFAKDDLIFGAYAVQFVAPDSGEPSDYLWHVRLDYNGTAPQLSVSSDPDKSTISLTATYIDEGTPPDSYSVCSQFAMLDQTLNEMIGSTRLGVVIQSIDDPVLAIRINEALAVPVASAWKVGAAIYFVEHVNPEVWQSIPLRYWGAKDISDIPPEYLPAWNQYGDILHDLYTMIVFSGNHEAANVLTYAFNTIPVELRAGRNPIMSFNDWSLEIGLSPQSGIYNWRYSPLTGPTMVDSRYAHRQIEVNGKPLYINNMYTAEDLSLYYLRLAVEGQRRGYYDTLTKLLSIRTVLISQIESHLLPSMPDYKLVRTISKDGYFGPDSLYRTNHYVNNDAGLLLFADGRQYIVAFTAFDDIDLQRDVIGTVLHNLVEFPAPSNGTPCAGN